MNFIPHTQKELKSMNLENDSICTVKYMNRDYFNGDERLEVAKAKVVINDGKYLFIVSDAYGMDKFINDVAILGKL